ncbi:MAG: imidazole glycerol phosphate synthase subunit HisF [Bacteroidetes bacterium]|nr:imidazole glycerol phosphate synthase subunit HisF [Bacteroidota bacterium]
MVLKRIMPCLLYDGSALVKTVRFKNPAYIGDPVNAIKIYNEKEVDELVLLDIRASVERRPPLFDPIREFASECFMPFTYGGGVKSLDDFARLYRGGVEKVVVNTLAFTRPDVVREAVKEYGSSSVVGSVDYRKGLFRGNGVYSASGQSLKRSLIDHCRFLADDLGVGELLLYSVDRDGTWQGFDLPTIREIANAVSIPVIASGGAGNVNDVRQVFETTAANAAALGSMAVYQKQGMGVLINFPRREEVITDEFVAGSRVRNAA